MFYILVKITHINKNIPYKFIISLIYRSRRKFWCIICQNKQRGFWVIMHWSCDTHECTRQPFLMKMATKWPNYDFFQFFRHQSLDDILNDYNQLLYFRFWICNLMLTSNSWIRSKSHSLSRLIAHWFSPTLNRGTENGSMENGSKGQCK